MLKRSVLAIFVMSAFVPVAHPGGVTVVGTVTKVGLRKFLDGSTAEWWTRDR
jgi:hypothetical protein